MELSSRARASLTSHIVALLHIPEVEHEQLVRMVPRWQYHMGARHFRAWTSLSRGSQARARLDNEVALHRHSIEVLLSIKFSGRAFHALKERTLLIRERRAAVSRASACEEAWGGYFEEATVHQVLLAWRQVASRAKLQGLQLQVISLQSTESEMQQQLRRLQTQHDHLRGNTALEAETRKLRQMQLRTTLLGKFFRHELAAAFLSFVHACQRARLEAREDKIKMRVVQRMRQAPLIAALQGWRQKTRDERQLRNKARKVMMRLVKVGLVLAFERWREHITEQKAMQQKANKVMMHFMKAEMVRGFERWRNHVSEEKTMRNKALKVVQRLMNSVLMMAFELWSQHLMRDRELKGTAVKVIKRRLNQTLSHAIDLWLDFVSALKAQRHESVSQMHISNLEGQLALVKVDLESRQEQVLSKTLESGAFLPIWILMFTIRLGF